MNIIVLNKKKEQERERKMNLTTDQKRIVFNCLRQGIYFFLSLFLIFGLRGVAYVYKENTFREFGIIENIQLSLLVFCIISFFFQGVKSKKFRPILFLFSSLCLFAVCREMDSLFDNIIPFISWKFCYIFPLLAGIYLFKKRKKLKQQIFLFCSSPAFYMMCSAMFIFIPLAQAIGNRAFIASVLPDATDVILMRRFVEESCEILAYFILLISSIEFYISLIKNRK